MNISLNWDAACGHRTGDIARDVPLEKQVRFSTSGNEGIRWYKSVHYFCGKKSSIVRGCQRIKGNVRFCTGSADTENTQSFTDTPCTMRIANLLQSGSQGA
jgi:hypothetical protein